MRWNVIIHIRFAFTISWLFESLLLLDGLLLFYKTWFFMNLIISIIFVWSIT